MFDGLKATDAGPSRTLCDRCCEDGAILKIRPFDSMTMVVMGRMDEDLVGEIVR